MFDISLGHKPWISSFMVLELPSYLKLATLVCSIRRQLRQAMWEHVAAMWGEM